MPTKLILHPDTPISSVTMIRADASRYASDQFSLAFRAVGAIPEIMVPRVGNERQCFGYEGWVFADRLWEHTCFEAFVEFEGVAGYFEYHVATSAQWASYSFASYREGMVKAEEFTLRSGSWRVTAHRIEVGATFEIPKALRGRAMKVGLSAIVEEKTRQKSYWALRHPLGRPDFHHPDCFALTLPAPGAA